MLRSSLIGASVALLCASAAGQGVLQKHPVTAPVRDAGVLNWATGTWDRASGSFANAPGATVAFNNTCNWSGGAFFGGTYDCWQVYDEGRIPSSGDPTFGGLGATDCQVICGFQFTYCTNDAGPYNAQFGFIQGINTSGIGGRCAGVVQGITPPSNIAKGQVPANFGDACDLYVDGTGAFPGAAAPPNQSCWLITIDLSTAFPNAGFSGAPFRADGDCTYEGNATTPDNDFDLFNWTFEQKGNTATNGAQGPFIVGGSINQGAGAYGTPTSTDPLTGNPCGEGLGTFDNFWINVGLGGSPNSCAAIGQPAIGAGSGCYFFGGFPGNPWASWHMVVWTSGEDCSASKCDTVVPGITTYCTAKTSSAGCVSQVDGTGAPAGPTSGAGDYSVTATGVQGFKPGIMFFGVNGAAAIPFSGGTLCMFPPLGRAPIQISGGSSPVSCDGTFAQNVNDGTVSPNLDQGPGTSNWCQFWNRDPNNGAGNLGTQLSNAAQIDFN